VGRICAVAVAVRALHVGHFFTDGNGRLNTMVILDKLLLQNGYYPAPMGQTDLFGGAPAHVLAQKIVDGMNEFVRLQHGSPADQHKLLPDNPSWLKLHIERCPAAAPLAEVYGIQ
jgi:hypothetical protein